ncbi:unnamed protein product [Rotaria sordida]|uniref:HMG box domain-containing protein n=1 Tax=Rotaria sordida TaxID=392033 RepID=A0A815J593_9BILA|nr:unnamed protein product [Rotaria sordida]
MWTTGVTHMLARLTGSTLFANHHLTSIIGYDHRLASTTSVKTPSSSLDNVGESLHVVAKLRDLRARTPYALFVKDNYSETSKKYPDLKMTDISKKISEAWKNLSDDKKQTYAKISQDQRAIYEREKNRLSAADLQKVDADEKARRIENRVKKSIQQLPTKKPRTAFIHFLSTLDRGNADLRDFMKGAAQRWSQMSTEEKQKFEDLHEEEKQQYNQTLVSWAALNKEALKPKIRRSSSSASSKKKDEVKATSPRRTRTAQKKTGESSKSIVSAAKSTDKKSTKGTSDKEKSSSSSSGDESSPKMKRSVKTTDSKKS